MNVEATAQPTIPALPAQTHHVFASAAVLSVLIHVVLAWSVYDKALFRFDLNLLRKPDRVYRVRRADPDAPMFMQPSLDQDRTISSSEDLSKMSQSLLVDEDSPQRPLGLAPDVTIRSSNPTRQSDADRLSSITLPQASGQDELVAQLVGNLELAVPFVENNDPPRPDTEQTGSRSKSTAPGHKFSPSALVDARSLPIGMPMPPDLDPPRPIKLIRNEERPAVASVATTIDLSRLALYTATALQVPEFLDHDFTYKLFTFTPLKGWFDDEETSYFRIELTGRRTLKKLRTMPRDVVYLVDTSGSVAQAWVDATIRAVEDALNYLNAGDRFNIVLFKDTPAFFHTDSIQPVSTESLAAARQFLNGARASGYTDVNQALSRLMVRDLDAERVYDLILISDGYSTRGIKDTRELINLITYNNDLAASIYCVGIGTKQDRLLLDFLAYRNRGFCVFAKSSDHASQIIRELASRLRFPIIKDVSMTVSGLDGDNVFPQNIPNIHQSESFSIYGRFAQLESFTMQLGGRNHGNDVAITFTRDLSRAHPGKKSMPGQWAFGKLYHLYSELIRGGDESTIKRKIRYLRKKYNIKTVE